MVAPNEDDNRHAVHLFVSDLNKAVLWAWYIVGVAGIFILLVPVLAPEGILDAFLPACKSRAADGVRCQLCGMTTAFYHISSGRIVDALSANRSSLALYLSLLVNGLVLVRHLVCRIAYRKGIAASDSWHRDAKGLGQFFFKWR
jgi:hypothetical protein